MQNTDSGSQNAKSLPAAIGFRVKSGSATAVLLVGPVKLPRVIDRRVLKLSDPAAPQSSQPYHAVLEMSEEKGRQVLERLVNAVQSFTKRSVTELLRDYRNAGCDVRSAVLVVGSEIDPASIKNPHIRAHALEGRLFRTTLADAVCSYGLQCSAMIEKEAYSKASSVLRRPEDDLKRVVSALGRSLRMPWRADEKTAAVAAWMALL